MRVIAGSAKRLQLQTIEGLDTRPTTDRIKETLFNMIHNDIFDCDFLDLFSGSGAIGIEALSRGCNRAVFIENNVKAIDCIRKNLVFTKLEKNADVLCMDVKQGIRQLSNQRKKFDIIFIDPPYAGNFEKEVLALLLETKLLKESGTIIIEASIDTHFEYLNESPFIILKEKLYKTNKHVFIQYR